MCGWEGQKAIEVGTLPIHVKRGIMDYVHAFLHVNSAIETIDCECRHQNKGTVKVWKLRERVCGWKGQKATEVVTLHVK